MPSNSPPRPVILALPDGEWVSGPDVDALVTALLDGFIDQVPPADTPLPAAWQQIGHPSDTGI